MKILHVIDSLKAGGAEKLVSEIVPLIKRKGHQVDVFLFNGEETMFTQSLMDEGIRILSYKDGGHVYNPLIVFKLIKIISNYDVIHTHNTPAQFFVAVANILMKKKLITTEHSTSNRRRAKSFMRVLDYWMYSQYEKIIAISNDTKVNLINYIPKTKNKIILIYNGVNLLNFINAMPLETYLNKRKRFVVTMVAGFRYQKDHETAIKSFQFLNKDEYELWLVGDGELKSQIYNLIEELNLSDNVKIWGNRLDVPIILKTSDVILQSSHIEGFGLAALEGMASGKPVVATNIPGLNQIVGGAGVLFEHCDEQALAKEIVRLKNDKEWYKTVSLRCKRRAEDFDIKNMVEGYCKVYNSL